MSDFFSPFLALNGISYVRDGDGTSTIDTSLGKLSVDAVQTALSTGRFEGLDYTNLGSPGVDGNDIITLAAGAAFPIHRNVTVSFAYERPITGRRDIFKQRATLSVLLEL